MGTIITGTGSYIPELIKSNAHFMYNDFYADNNDPLTDNNEVIIRKFKDITGIEERRYLSRELSSSDAAAIAGRKAIDAANIDLKAFTEDFYFHLTGGHLQPVLDTIEYVKNHTNTWMELTTLLIPDQNDSDEEVSKLAEWVRDHVGLDVPLHFSAFHPDWKMMDTPPTPPSTLLRAREIALEKGIHYVYVGNVHNKAADSTYCHHCHKKLIGRDWYVLSDWNLTDDGKCRFCNTPCAGLFSGPPGTWGAKRLPVRISQFA